MSHTRWVGPIIGTLLAISSASGSPADSPDTKFVPTYLPSLHVSRAPSPIKIDGDLSDQGWQEAQPATSFTEHSPGEEVCPPVHTEAFVTYDDDHLYLAAICHAAPGTVRASLCERERIFSDDNIGFFFDTYGDASRAYIINVNPFGIPYDALWTPEYGEDQNFDLMFESAGKITDSGYQVELAIPFASLRFPNKPVQSWRFDFYRHHFREVHYSMSWSANDKKESCWPCQWGTVSGIENVTPGRGIEFLPSFAAHQSGAASDTASAGKPFKNSAILADLSLGGKYAISSDIVLEATYNPDFSQIESDASQVDVNTTFALSYPEKRPFFQEGMDLFRTNFNAVYTRSVNSPDFAAKTSAQIGRTSIALLSAHDRQSLDIIPFEERSAYVPLGKTFVNMLAVRHAFGRDNHIRTLITDQRIEGGGAGTLASIDGALRFTKSIDLRGQFVVTHTDEPNNPAMTSDLEGQVFAGGKHTATFDGESFWGNAALATIQYNTLNTGASLQGYFRTPTYRAANGFQPRNSDRHLEANFHQQIRPKGSIFCSHSPGFNFGRIWNADGIRKNDWQSLQWSSQFRFAQLGVAAEYQMSTERFQGADYRNLWYMAAQFEATPISATRLGATVIYGHQVAYDNQAVGKQLILRGWVEFRPVNRLLIEPDIEFTQSRDLHTDKEFYNGYIAGTRVGYQCSRELSLRLVGEFNNFAKRWGVDPLITYRLNPFSTFYAGATYDYDRFTIFDHDVRRATTRLSSRQYFVKIQYLFQT